MVEIAIPTAPFTIHITAKRWRPISKVPKVTITVTIAVPKVAIPVSVPKVTPSAGIASTAAAAVMTASGRVDQGLWTSRRLTTQRRRNGIIRATGARGRPTVLKTLGRTISGVEPRQRGISLRHHQRMLGVVKGAGGGNTRESLLLEHVSLEEQQLKGTTGLTAEDRDKHRTGWNARSKRETKMRANQMACT